MTRAPGRGLHPRAHGLSAPDYIDALAEEVQCGPCAAGGGAGGRTGCVPTRAGVTVGVGGQWWLRCNAHRCCPRRPPAQIRKTLIEAYALELADERSRNASSAKRASAEGAGRPGAAPPPLRSAPALRQSVLELEGQLRTRALGLPRPGDGRRRAPWPTAGAGRRRLLRRPGGAAARCRGAAARGARRGQGRGRGCAGADAGRWRHAAALLAGCRWAGRRRAARRRRTTRRCRAPRASSRRTWACGEARAECAKCGPASSITSACALRWTRGVWTWRRACGGLGPRAVRRCADR